MSDGKKKRDTNAVSMAGQAAMKRRRRVMAGAGAGAGAGRRRLPDYRLAPVPQSFPHHAVTSRMFPGIVPGPGSWLSAAAHRMEFRRRLKKEQGTVLAKFVQALENNRGTIELDCDGFEGDEKKPKTLNVKALVARPEWGLVARIAVPRHSPDGYLVFNIQRKRHDKDKDWDAFLRAAWAAERSSRILVNSVDGRDIVVFVIKFFDDLLKRAMDYCAGAAFRVHLFGDVGYRIPDEKDPLPFSSRPDIFSFDGYEHDYVAEEFNDVDNIVSDATPTYNINVKTDVWKRKATVSCFEVEDDM